MLAAATAAGAQNAQSAASEEQACLGFSFGNWKPALNWHAAGHGEFPDSSRLPHAPMGRDWAMNSGDPDSTLMLFPAFWPVGVLVSLPTRSPAAGDTVTGEAIALRADAASEPSRARVRAWRVTCGAARGISKP
jgi:hypothetical protein